MDKLISIIVPVYNVEKYLRRCIDSILNQTYHNLDVILIDDGSTDESGKICDEYACKDNRIRVIHKPNGGLSSARNIGIDNAKGDYIGFVDSDDWVEPEMFYILKKNLEEYDADVSDINAKVVKDEFPFKNSKEKITCYEGTDILRDYFISDRYACWRKLYTKSAISDVRFPDGKINEDIIANYLFLKNAKKIVKSSLVMYHYYNNPLSITGKMFKEKDFDLIDICNLLVCEAKDQDDIYRLAKIKLGTAYYSLLGRYIAYDSSNFIGLDEKVAQLHKALRKNYFLLMGSHLPVKKKILITIVTLFDPINLKKLKDFFKERK